MGPELLMIAGSVASAALQAKAASDQADKQQSLVDQMTQYKLQKSAEGQAATSKFLDTQDPAQRQAAVASTQQGIASNLQNSVKAAQQYQTPQNFAGKVSGDYTQRAASDAGTVADRLKRSIDQLSTIGAPAQTDLQRSLQLGQASTGVAGANSAAANVGNAFDTGINNVRPDPFLTLAAQIAGGAGKGLAARSLVKNPLGLGFDYTGALGTS